MTVIELAKELISCPSVTPETAGVFDVIERFLVPAGFTVIRQSFDEAGTAPVENLYLRYGKTGKNFCFAGHTDVVPVGDEKAWRVPPFNPKVIDGELYGRGAEDMKGAVAAFMVAARDFIASREILPSKSSAQGVSLSPRERLGEGGIRAEVSGINAALEQARPSPLAALDPLPLGEGFPAAPLQVSPEFSISLLITQDEEGIAINGTRKMLEFLKARGEKLDVCIVGEPTNPNVLGEMAKIGRRGSISFSLTVVGKQGHVAYPALADNPVTRIAAMCAALKAEAMDAGNEHFPSSNLEVTTIDVGNPTVNMIPARATAQFNVRFNDMFTSEKVIAWVRARLDAFGAYELTHRLTGESFLTKDDALANIVVEAVKDVTGMTPALSTTGGTSDARFIKDYCPVIEFGTTGRTSHMVDERVEVKTLEGLTKIYGRMLERYFR